MKQSQQSETFQASQQGTWAKCERYGFQVTGCSRFFACLKEGLEACYKTYPKETRYKHIRISDRLKQIGFNVKQGVRRIKVVGV